MWGERADLVEDEEIGHRSFGEVGQDLTKRREIGRGV